MPINRQTRIHFKSKFNKKFYNKVRQYQELSQVEKQEVVNFGSRMGKSAEILCELAAISQIIKISLDILK